MSQYNSPIQRALKFLSNGRIQSFYPEFEGTRTQDLEPAFYDTGQFYWGKKNAWLANSKIHSKDDYVWTSPITFVASANCALYCGAKVDFVDIDPCTYNLSVECLAEKLALAKKIGKLPKIVIPVHLAGQPCDMLGIYELSQQYGFKISSDGRLARSP